MATDAFTIRTDSETAERLDTSASRFACQQNDPVDQASKDVLDLPACQIDKIQEGIEAAERGQTIPHEDVMAEMDALIQEHIERHESRQCPIVAI